MKGQKIVSQTIGAQLTDHRKKATPWPTVSRNDTLEASTARQIESLEGITPRAKMERINRGGRVLVRGLYHRCITLILSLSVTYIRLD